ncbi:MAG: hypothetical protein U1A27_10270 [Phycisphaerae bacterium]
MKRAILGLAGIVVMGVIVGGCGTNPSDGGGGGGGGGSDLPSFGLAGRLSVSGTSRKRPFAHADGTSDSYSVYASSNETGESYVGTTDGDGNFAIELPIEEAGNTIIVTVVDPQNHAVGPVLMETQGNEGVTGLALSESASLGTIELPADPSAGPLMAGSDAELGDQMAMDVTARLDGNGVPVGVPSIGKGSGAAASGGSGSALDADRDGLIDIFDADNNGNGTVDDFEAATDFGGVMAGADFQANFFMNLKVSDGDAGTYYSGTQSAIDAALASQTVITFEILPTPMGKTITGVHVVSGPSYLADMTEQVDTGMGLQFQPWSDHDYAFTHSGDRWQAFVVPHALIQAGDTFVVEVSYSDDTTDTYRRMINYVFKNIPRLMEHGTPSGRTAYTSGEVVFDGTQDLVLKFRPPVDETGAYLTGFDYFFEIFYNDSMHQQVQNVNWSASFGGTPPPGFDNGKYVVHAADLGALAGDNTYTVTIPKEVFRDTLVKNDTSTVSIDSYKIDIAAQNSGNAAIMLPFRKQ